MGFYDTGEEGDRTKEMREQFRPQTLEELEGRRRQVGPTQARGRGRLLMQIVLLPVLCDHAGPRLA